MKRVILTGVFALAAGTALSATTCEVSKAQYDALQPNSTYEQVVAVLGCHGEEMSSSEMAGYRTVMLMWNGNSFGGNMNVMIQNGRLVSKAQFGLK